MELPPRRSEETLMTANRDLKRRVRDRQAHTGESYMTALHHVLGQRPSSIPSAIPTVEFLDATEAAAALGLKCRISVSPALAHTIDVEQTLRRFRTALTTTWRDPALALLRSIALHGEHVQVPMIPAPGFRDVQEAVRFLERVLAGFSGISDDGRMLALRAVPRPGSGGASPASEHSHPAVDEPMAVFSPWLVPVILPSARLPLLIINTLDEFLPGPILERLRTDTR
jgi:hypothetical protein